MIESLFWSIKKLNWSSSTVIIPTESQTFVLSNVLQMMMAIDDLKKSERETHVRRRKKKCAKEKCSFVNIRVEDSKGHDLCGQLLMEWNDTNCVTPITWTRINLTNHPEIQPLDDDWITTHTQSSIVIKWAHTFLAAGSRCPRRHRELISCHFELHHRHSVDCVCSAISFFSKPAHELYSSRLVNSLRRLLFN